jgi:hypothetical protein
MQATLANAKIECLTGKIKEGQKNALGRAASVYLLQMFRDSWVSAILFKSCWHLNEQ